MRNHNFQKKKFVALGDIQHTTISFEEHGEAYSESQFRKLIWKRIKNRYPEIPVFLVKPGTAYAKEYEPFTVQEITRKISSQKQIIVSRYEQLNLGISAPQSFFW